MAIVKVVRDIPRLNWGVISYILNEYVGSKNPIFELIYEMGNTMNVTGWVILLVPAARNFLYGASYFTSLLTLIPNVFWNIHPAVKAGTLADWLVMSIDPSFAEIGGGYGFSIFAEAYMNFGYYFSLLFIFVVGMIVMKFILWGWKEDRIARRLVRATFFSFSLVIARGETVSIMRYLMWYSIFPYIAVKFITSRKQKVGKNNV